MATGLARAWELAPHPRLRSIPFQGASKHDHISWKKRKMTGDETHQDYCAFTYARKLTDSAGFGFASLDFQAGTNAFRISHRLYWLSQSCKLITHKTAFCISILYYGSVGKAWIATHLLALWAHCPRCHQTLACHSRGEPSQPRSDSSFYCCRPSKEKKDDLTWKVLYYTSEKGTGQYRLLIR